MLVSRMRVGSAVPRAEPEVVAGEESSAPRVIWRKQRAAEREEVMQQLRAAGEQSMDEFWCSKARHMEGVDIDAMWESYRIRAVSGKKYCGCLDVAANPGPTTHSELATHRFSAFQKAELTP